MGKPNPYEILDISPSASKKQVTQAYRRLAQRFHPDLQPAEKKDWAGERMKQINQAYDVLSDSEARARYDTTNGTRPSTSPFKEEWFTATYPYRTPRWPRFASWSRFGMLVSFTLWSLTVGFLVVGAYLISVEWHYAYNDFWRAEEYVWHWMFALTWCGVLMLSLLKTVRPRR